MKSIYPPRNPVVSVHISVTTALGLDMIQAWHMTIYSCRRSYHGKRSVLHVTLDFFSPFGQMAVASERFCGGFRQLFFTSDSQMDHKSSLVLYTYLPVSSWGQSGVELLTCEEHFKTGTNMCGTYMLTFTHPSTHIH